MNAKIEICLNRATEAEITGHLYCCDADFIPPLSGRVVISNYARKITEKATRFEVWADGALVGLVAVYYNDSEHRVAYITSVSVLRGWQGLGIASKLMERCIHYAKELSYERIALEVDRDNVAAIRLYMKKGFMWNGCVDRTVSMHLSTGKIADCSRNVQ